MSVLDTERGFGAPYPVIFLLWDRAKIKARIILLPSCTDFRGCIGQAKNDWRDPCRHFLSPDRDSGLSNCLGGTSALDKSVR